MKTINKVQKLKSFIMIIICSFYLQGYAGNLKGGFYLEMYGNAKQAKEWESGALKNLDNAKFTVCNEKQEVLGVYYSNKAGVCFLKLPVNCLFEIKVSKTGWATKIIKVDAHVPKGKLMQYRLPFEIDMFEDIPELDVSILKAPIAYVVFNGYLNRFDYSFFYTKEVNKKLKKLYSDYYRLCLKYKTTKTILLENNATDSLETKNVLPLYDNNTLQEKEKSFGSLSLTLTDDEILKNYTSNNTGQYTIVFKIQILSLCCHLPLQAKIFVQCGKVNEYVFNDQYKYTIGEYKTLDAALKEMNEIRKKGYNDAFIVAFLNGNRMTLNNDLKSFASALKVSD